MTRDRLIEECLAGQISLTLRSTFRTHWKTLLHHKTLHARLRVGEVWGEGEAYTLTPDEDLAKIRSHPIAGRTIGDLLATLQEIPAAAARSAIDLALHDLMGKLSGRPVHELLGLPRASRESCVSVGIDEPGAMLEAAKRWIDLRYPILKIKVTTSTDLGLIKEIRRLGGERLRIWVDANQAFEPDQLLRAATPLREAGVEILEQPMPVGRMAEYRSLRSAIGIPVILDEEILGREDVDAAIRCGGIDGVNVKLAKLGGIGASLRAIETARAHGLSILLGCYFESSLGISASTHLQALAERIDLDAPLLIEDDPYQGLHYEGAALAPPAGPGLGVERRAAPSRAVPEGDR